MIHGFTTLTKSKKNAEQTMETAQLTPPKKFKRVYSAWKAMASILWDQGVIMIDYFVQGRKIHGAYYAGELRQLSQEIS